jgi:hypothetical protein
MKIVTNVLQNHLLPHKKQNYGAIKIKCLQEMYSNHRIRNMYLIAINVIMNIKQLQLVSVFIVKIKYYAMIKIVAHVLKDH